MNTPAVCQHAFSYGCCRGSTNVLLYSSWAQKYSSWVLNTYTFITKKRFLQKNSKIASLMSCQMSHLWKTLIYSQSWDLEGIHWILWIYTDAAPAHSSHIIIRNLKCPWKEMHHLHCSGQPFESLLYPLTSQCCHHWKYIMWGEELGQNGDEIIRLPQSLSWAMTHPSINFIKICL